MLDGYRELFAQVSLARHTTSFFLRSHSLKRQSFILCSLFSLRALPSILYVIKQQHLETFTENFLFHLRNSLSYSPKPSPFTISTIQFSFLVSFLLSHLKIYKIKKSIRNKKHKKKNKWKGIKISLSFIKYPNCNLIKLLWVAANRLQVSWNRRIEQRSRKCGFHLCHCLRLHHLLLHNKRKF